MVIAARFQCAVSVSDLRKLLRLQKLASGEVYREDGTRKITLRWRLSVGREQRQITAKTVSEGNPIAQSGGHHEVWKQKSLFVNRPLHQTISPPPYPPGGLRKEGATIAQNTLMSCVMILFRLPPSLLHSQTISLSLSADSHSERQEVTCRPPSATKRRRYDSPVSSCPVPVATEGNLSPLKFIKNIAHCQ
ncbi:hypothetical protein CDAR_598251 [Caerostris darwini]|uniref:Uncharacterized protein n=1 Tax=Caerostris darwini TaxID=1538125 RepID=A0AAV4QN59_9ARAC|nr:hypothetical protein CDAR_598251 [Caerostris darwini]